MVGGGLTSWVPGTPSAANNFFINTVLVDMIFKTKIPTPLPGIDTDNYPVVLF